MSKTAYGRLVEASENKEYIGLAFDKCKRNCKEPIDTSDGQFTGGVWHETYLYDGYYYMFLFDFKGGFYLEIYASEDF